MRNSYRNTKKYNGSVSLITVILVGAIVLVSSINLVLTSIDVSKAHHGFQRSAFIKLASKTCLDESMNKLKKQLSFTGSIQYMSGSITCTSTVSNVDATTKSVSIVSTDGEYSYSIVYQVNITTSPITITAIN